MLPSLDQLSLAHPHYITQQPGIYVVNPALENPAKIAVNIEYNDSDPTRIPPKAKIKMLSGDYTKEIFMSRLGHDLWKLLLAISLALMILEIIIVKSQEHKSLYRSDT